MIDGVYKATEGVRHAEVDVITAKAKLDRAKGEVAQAEKTLREAKWALGQAKMKANDCEICGALADAPCIGTAHSGQIHTHRLIIRTEDNDD